MRFYLLVIAILSVNEFAAAVDIPMVAVGHSGNVADSNGQGTVAYGYQIGATEVTNAQYVEFLNAKAISDPFHLYDGGMGANPRGGIIQNGSGGNYSYSVKPNMANKPVNYVTWFDAARFVNWLQNGQGDGDTETGSYTLLGNDALPSNAFTVARNHDAQWALPNYNEWYKAGHYDPTLNDGAGGYWTYATRSNSVPDMAMANNVGDISNPGANIANYGNGGSWNAQDGNLTTVGSAGPLSSSFYGTADQAGNLLEYCEELGGWPGERIAVGSSWSELPETMAGSSPWGIDPTYAPYLINTGFRVAIVPEPSCCLLSVLALVSLLGFRHRIRRAAF